jgi:hypothetical protein
MPTTTFKVAGPGDEVSVMFSRMKDAVGAKADDRAQVGISGAREANNFTTHTVPLRCKHEECGEKVAEQMSASVARRRSRRQLPIRSWTSQSQRVDSWGKPYIHPGEGDKRKQCCTCGWQWRGYCVGAACAMVAMMQWRTWTGIGLTRFWGGSFFL